MVVAEIVAGIATAKSLAEAFLTFDKLVRRIVGQQLDAESVSERFDQIDIALRAIQTGQGGILEQLDPVKTELASLKQMIASQSTTLQQIIHIQAQIFANIQRENKEALVGNVLSKMIELRNDLRDSAIRYMFAIEAKEACRTRGISAASFTKLSDKSVVLEWFKNIDDDIHAATRSTVVEVEKFRANEALIVEIDQANNNYLYSKSSLEQEIDRNRKRSARNKTRVLNRLTEEETIQSRPKYVGWAIVVAILYVSAAILFSTFVDEAGYALIAPALLLAGAAFYFVQALRHTEWFRALMYRLWVWSFGRAERNIVKYERALRNVETGAAAAAQAFMARLPFEHQYALQPPTLSAVLGLAKASDATWRKQHWQIHKVGTWQQAYTYS